MRRRSGTRRSRDATTSSRLTPWATRASMAIGVFIRPGRIALARVVSPLVWPPPTTTAALPSTRPAIASPALRNGSAPSLPQGREPDAARPSGGDARAMAAVPGEAIENDRGRDLGQRLD